MSKNEKITAIYSIKSVSNNKIYIGKVEKRPVEIRWKEHKKYLSAKKHPNRHLQNAWNKHGEKDFIFSIIEKLPLDSEKEFICERESYWMQHYGGIHSGKIYNIIDSRESPTITEKERIQRSMCQRGDKGPRAITNWETVRKIRKEYYLEEISKADLGKRYGLSPSAVESILDNRSWYDPEYKPKKTVAEGCSEKTKRLISKANSGKNCMTAELTVEESSEIRIRYNNGESRRTLSKEFEVSVSAIDAVIQNRTWHDPKYCYTSSYNFLNSEKAIEVRRLWEEGNLSQREIAIKFNVSSGCISAIVQNRSFHDPEYVYKKRESPKGARSPSCILELEQILEIRRLWLEGVITYSELAFRFGVSTGCICGIVQNRTWYDPSYTYIPRHPRKPKS